MNWINYVSNMDSVIHDVCIKDSCLIVNVKTWDGKICRVIFSEYYGLKEKNAIGREIGDILIQTNSQFLEEIKNDIQNCDGSTDEIKEAKSITFYDSWNEVVLLEVLAENVDFIEWSAAEK